MVVLIIHGIGGCAGVHWQGWLASQLRQLGYKIIMPQMPTPNHPNRLMWLKTIKEKVKGLDLTKLIVVGHSLGVTTALDFVENLDSPINALVSVAGFSEDYGVELNNYFLKEKEDRPFPEV